MPALVSSRDLDYSQFSQEIRVAGDVTDWADIVAGGYYPHTNHSLRLLYL